MATSYDYLIYDTVISFVFVWMGSWATEGENDALFDNSHFALLKYLDGLIAPSATGRAEVLCIRSHN